MLRRWIAISSTLFLLIILTPYAWANENIIYWDGEGETNRWTDPINWSKNVIPTYRDHVVLDGRSTKDIEIHEQDHITISSLTVEPDYTGTMIADSPNTFKINGKLHIKGGRILWRQIRPSKRICFEDDVEIEGGNVEFIGDYKITKSFVWKNGMVRGKEANFHIYVNTLRTMDTGSYILELNSMNISQNASTLSKELQIKGHVTVHSNFTSTALVRLRVTDHSILDLRKIDKRVDHENIVVDPGSKLLIKDNNHEIRIDSLEDLYYSTRGDQSIITLFGCITGTDGNMEILLRYTIDDEMENTLIKCVPSENKQYFTESIELMDSLEEGKHMLNIWAEDSRNFCFHIRNLSFYVDKTVPTGDIEVVDSTIYLTAYDKGGSGLAEIILPNGTNQTVSGAVYETVYTVRGKGIYEFVIKDGAGNKNKVHTKVEEMDEEEEEEREADQDEREDEEEDQDKEDEEDNKDIDEEGEDDDPADEKEEEDKEVEDENEKDDQEEDEEENEEEDKKVDEEKGETDLDHREEDREENRPNSRNAIPYQKDNMIHREANDIIIQYTMNTVKYLLEVFKAMFSLRTEGFRYDPIVWLFE